MIKYELFNKEEVDKTKDKVIETVKEWHDRVHPDYVFVTETSGMPHGFLIKAAWKKAYPNEKPPIFYRINPAAIIPRSKFQPKIDEFIARRIKKDNASIIIYDEHRSGFYQVYGKGTMLVDKPDNPNYNPHYSNSSVGKVAIAIAGVYEKKKTKKTPGDIFISKGSVAEGKCLYDPEYKSTSKLYHSMARGLSEDEREYASDNQNPRLPEEDIRGRIVKNPEQRKRAIGLIKELKHIGREAGEELHKKLQIVKLRRKLEIA
ncbi:MAG: hypothetical protein KJ559_01100 [Nanoarchaeota archaeon]|nr:hypothetical protein [Nanoarchaeota archaeon]